MHCSTRTLCSAVRGQYDQDLLMGISSTTLLWPLHRRCSGGHFLGVTTCWSICCFLFFPSPCSSWAGQVSQEHRGLLWSPWEKAALHLVFQGISFGKSCWYHIYIYIYIYIYMTILAEDLAFQPRCWKDGSAQCAQCYFMLKKRIRSLFTICFERCQMCMINVCMSMCA